MSNSLIFKRLGAYIIDFMVIFLINSAIAYIGFINPKYEEYKVVSDNYTQIMNDYYEKKIDINEFNNKTKDMAYDMNKSGYVYIVSDVIITFLYFGVFQCITKGQTLGKKLMNIKVVKAKEKELKWYNYFIRAFILNGVILNILTFIAVWFSKDTYYKIYEIATNIDYLLMIGIFVMIMFNKEGRGLHDVLAGTKVIDVRSEKNEVAEAEIKVIDKDEKEEIQEKFEKIEANVKSNKEIVEESKKEDRKKPKVKTTKNSNTKMKNNDSKKGSKDIKKS